MPPERSQTAVCFDAARGVDYPRPRLRGVLHQVSFAVSLVTGPLLLTAAHVTTSKIAAGVYAASVTGMFAASTLYHRQWHGTDYHNQLRGVLVGAGAFPRCPVPASDRDLRVWVRVCGLSCDFVIRPEVLQQHLESHDGDSDLGARYGPMWI